MFVTIKNKHVALYGTYIQVSSYIKRTNQMDEIIKKTLYCVQMINLIKWFSNAGADDYKKRIISRSIFVYLDAFFNFAPQIKNSLESRDVNVKTIHEKIGKIRDEYEQYHSKIRDKLAAHRQDLPIIETFEVWNEIDIITLDYFITEVLDIYNLLHALKRDEIPAYFDFPITSKKIKPSAAVVTTKPTLTSDNLALTRPSTVSFIPCNAFQKRGSQINSIIDTTYFLGTMYPDENLSKDFERLVKSMIVVDVINLLDNLYPYTPSDPKHKIESFFEILETSKLAGHKVLVSYNAKRNFALEDKIRNVRNKICAHIDSTETLDNILNYLDNLTIDELNLIFIPAVEAFGKSCQADFRTRLLLMNNMNLSDDVIGVEDTGFIKDFE